MFRERVGENSSNLDVGMSRKTANILLDQGVLNSRTDAEDILTFLKEKGYSLLQKLGEGKTRAAFLAQYNSGYTSSLRVVKIPFENYDETSLCTTINKSKRNLDQNEAIISNLLIHPNLISILDNFNHKNISINVEEYFQQAQSLEELVGKTGAINDHKKFMNIFSQVILGVEYANFNDTNRDRLKLFREGILLRDIKPSNILVGNEGFVKHTDFQNAAKMENIVELSLPTRGGTAYTRPDLINSLITGLPEKATRQTEVYAVAASMYYALTGHDAFDYKIKEIFSEEQKGVQINVGDVTHKINLLIDGVEQPIISKDKHEVALKLALKEVPLKYRKVLYKGLTLNDNNSYTNIISMKNDFEKLNTPTRRDFIEGLYNSIRPALMILAGGIAIGAIGLFGQYQNARTPARPTMMEILQTQDYNNFSMKTWNNSQDSLYTMDLLKNNFDDLRLDLPKILIDVEGEKTEELEYVNMVSSFSKNVHQIDERLMTSLLASCAINGSSVKEVNKIYGVNGNEQRLDKTYVPKGFVLRVNSRFNGANTSDSEKGAMAALYLKACMAGQGIGNSTDESRGDVADLFASYFCSNEEINTARIKTNSLKYFPRLNGSFLEIGYGRFLPFEKVNLINDAVAIYLITDESGKINLDKIPKLDGLYGQYKELLGPH
ncbi:MAG: hypothetical protein WC758_03370 [Candidatus Woesearchaeota archaeon]|jgi:serine/threonine protein kinase